MGYPTSPTALKRITDKHSEVLSFCVNFKFPGRGQRDTPIATEEGIYQILMLCPGKRGAEFRKFSAQVLRERREEESNPELAYTRGRQRAINTWKRQGLSDHHIQQRIEGIEKRLTFTDRLQQHGVTDGRGFAQCTNAIYQGLFDATAKELRESRGLPARVKLRDALSEDEVREVGISEDLAAMRIKKKGANGADTCAGVSYDAARYVRSFIDG